MATWGTAGISLKGPKGDPGEDYDPAALDAKADDSAVVHNTGSESIQGYKLFTQGIGVAQPSQANSAIRNDDSRLVRWPSAYTLSYGSTITPNCNNGSDQRVTLTGNTTVALATNPTDGQYLLLWFYASGADRTVTMNSGYETSQPVPGRVFTIPSGTWGSVLVRRRGSTWVLMAAYPQPVSISLGQTVCRLHLSSDQSYASDGSNWRYVSAWSIDYDPLGVYSVGAVTVPSLPGVTQWRAVFSGRFVLQGNTAGWRIGTIVRNFGTNPLPAANSLREAPVTPRGDVIGDYFSSVYEGPLSAGDVLRPALFVNQGSGTVVLSAVTRNLSDSFFTLTPIG